MRGTVTILFMFYSSLAISTDVDSYEFNHIDLNPIHDAIIFNDVANIMNEIENNMNPQVDNHMFSNSESDEDIENLLLEYQQYLDKAHEQTVNYIKKSKGKNNVPVLRREKFTKLQPILRSNLDKSNIYFDIKHPPATFINKFVSQSSNVNAGKRSEYIQNTLKSLRDEKKLISLPPTLPNMTPELILSTCYCKENVIPCKCGCKQCLIIENSIIPTTSNKLNIDQNYFTQNFQKKSKSLFEKDLNNNLNIRIKIDVKFPNMSNILGSGVKLQYDDGIEKDKNMISNGITKIINLPFPYINFPIPVVMTGYKQNVLKNKSPSVHKITIHKKNKYRLSNNKKQKNRKYISLHHFKFEPQMQQNVTGEHLNSAEIDNNNNSSDIVEVDKFLIKNISDTQLNTTVQPQINNTSNNKSVETIYLTLNISKDIDNNTERIIKSENSIETDISSDKENVTNLTTLRLKREIKDENFNLTATSNDTNRKNQYMLPQDKLMKNSAIDFIADTDLLYWPLIVKNQSLILSKNITALILEREIKKDKLNMTQNSIRNNRTMALEKAIFGNVDWNDVNAVVPVFMSFVGKYIRGALTFCSENICHSMKCAEKICYHRICTTENRYNRVGHCAGNNLTDSVANMEYIMDLPSNVAFEIVDILQAKMLGKIFGIATLCINTKCSAFAVYKKKFQKAKCSLKDLNSTGHCPNIKNVKNI